MRYLLADEVGLGKTIEAGLVIRQVLIDDPDASVLVLAPNGLVGQWTREMHDRLALGTALDDKRLAIHPHEDPLAHADIHQYSLVVIDEAHNLLRRIDEGSPVECALREVDALLALSATPMRGDPRMFRRLLRLVDPIAFHDVTEKSFEQRLNERERSARDLQVLASRRASVRQKSAVVESLTTMFAHDGNVRDLAARCTESDDPRGEPWLALADYVREAYRLSRRMIRHRRDGELVDGYVVAGRRPVYIEVHDPARQVVDEFLDLYRYRLEDTDQDEIYSQAVLHALAGPRTLHGFLSARLRLPSGDRRAPRDEDRSLFADTVARLELRGLHARLDAAMDVVWERVDSGLKVVVCSSFVPLATAFHERVVHVVNEYHVFQHLGDMTAFERDDAVADFLNTAGGVVLVSDRSMEEGRNLQEAHVLVNLDLPLDASRLDQRIGRLDRYAVRPDPAEVIVFTESSSEWVTAQVRLLAEGTGVFDISVSTVQRMLSNLLQTVLNDLLPRGVDALNVDIEQLRADLDDEREDIDLLEELESVSAGTAFGGDAFRDLIEYEDGDETTLRSAVKRLTHGTGSLQLKPVEWYNGVVTFAGAHDIGLPSDQVPAFHRLMSAPKTYSRQTAIARYGAAPFRIGDPLVDWLHQYLLADERGRAYAVVRPAAGLSTPTLWLHSEFLIEFHAGHMGSFGDGVGRGLARRGDALLQPVRFETWTDPSGQAPAELVASLLDLPFDTCREEEVLRGRIWKPVLEEFPAWTELVGQSADAARGVVDDSEELHARREGALAHASEEIAKRRSILKARSLRLPTEQERAAAVVELELEAALGDALLAGIERPSVRMVACGVCVLWPEVNF
jgi:ATP-dependent helicase HepA